MPSNNPARGFTLLELVVAVTILATFLLPMMLIVTRSKVRAIKYTQQREVRDLAQRKLFDRIHYYEEKDRGDFSVEGHPSWTWEVSLPEIVSGGMTSSEGGEEQVLLQYTIRVSVPQNLEESSSSTSGLGSGSQEGSTYEMSLWTFPDERWYEEQEYLMERGQYSPLNDSLMTPGGSF
jgi:prepilin-type N-terminal cleavage/methylation domain-containing protein